VAAAARAHGITSGKLAVAAAVLVVVLVAGDTLPLIMPAAAVLQALAAQVVLVRGINPGTAAVLVAVGLRARVTKVLVAAAVEK
jgi:hypothetical protein